MPEFTVNPTRHDPYKNFKFVVISDKSNQAIAGVSKVSGLARNTGVIKHHVGGDQSTSRKSPGLTEYDALTLERGVTHDLEFHSWAQQVWNYGAAKGMESSLNGLKRNLTINILNEAGQVAKVYHVYNCWVSSYSLSELDSNSPAIWFETIKVENEGWTIDLDAPEPSQPSF